MSTVCDSDITLDEDPGKTGSCLSSAPGELVAGELSFMQTPQGFWSAEGAPETLL